MIRLMVEHDRPAPKGWTACADAATFLKVLRETDAADIAAVAIRGTVDDCVDMLEATARVTNQQFHLMNGMVTMERVHFHDPDIAHAEACRQKALNIHKEHTLPNTDLSVPIGDWSVWIRGDRRVVIVDATLPESAMMDMVGHPISRLVDSPMLPEGMIVRGFVDHPRDLYISIDLPETQT